MYGDQTSRPSYIREDARLELTMGTLGGPGRLNLDGDMLWTAAQFSSSSLKSSCRTVGGGTDTLPEYCKPDFDPVDGRGRLVVGGSLTVRSGSFNADGDLVDDGKARGVNLAQRYDLRVAADGEVRVLDDAYVAQAHTTTIEVQTDGDWIFDGDGDVLQGAFEGTPSNQLPPFVNEGTLTKESGGGGSSIDTVYSGGGDVVIKTGTLTTPGGFRTLAEVAPGESLGTFDCPPPPNYGSVAEDCEFDRLSGKSVTSAQDLQAAELKVPATAGPDARVQIHETTTQGVDDLQPPIEIASTGLEPEAVTEVGFEFSNKISTIPAKQNVRIFRRAGAANWREVPPCKDDPSSPFKRGVTACTKGQPTDRGDDSAIRWTVLTTTPRGKWVLRRQPTVEDPVIRRVAVRDNGTFEYLGMEEPPSWDYFSALEMSSAGDDDHCGPHIDNTWEVHRTLLVPAASDDHAVGWWPSATGEARGFEVPIADLADLGAAALRLRMESGELRGYARVVRRESASVSWIGRANVVPADAELFAGGPWRLVQAAELDYTWQRRVGGVPDGTPVFTDTLEDFLADHEPKVAGAGPDTLGFAFGCTGEEVFVNDLTVQKLDVPAPTLWDLEAPQAIITSPGKGIGRKCQITRNGFPNVVNRTVEVAEDIRWVARKWTPSPAGPILGDPFDGGEGPGKFPITLPSKPGQLIFETVPTDDRRSGFTVKPIRFKVTADIKLLRITKTRKAIVGQRIVLEAAVKPRSALGRPLPIKLWVARPGTRRLLAAQPRRTDISVRNGVVTARYRTSAPGRYWLALQYTKAGELSAAMSNRAAVTEVKERPRVDQGQSDNTNYVAGDTDVDEENSNSTGGNFGGRREVARRETCVFYVR